MVVIDFGLKLRYALHWIDLFVLKMTLNRSLIDKFTPKIDKRNLTIQPYDTDMIPYDNIWLSSKAKENEKKVQLKYCQIIPGWVSNNFYVSKDPKFHDVSKDCILLSLPKSKYTMYLQRYLHFVTNWKYKISTIETKYKKLI